MRAIVSTESLDGHTISHDCDGRHNTPAATVTAPATLIEGSSRPARITETSFLLISWSLALLFHCISTFHSQPPRLFLLNICHHGHCSCLTRAFER